MKRHFKIIAAICLLAESFTTLILSLVYAERKREYARLFFGFSLVGGLGGAYLLYSEYQDYKDRCLAADGDDWCSDECDCCEDDFFDEGNADDINFTISEDEKESGNGSEEPAPAQ